MNLESIKENFKKLKSFIEDKNRIKSDAGYLMFLAFHFLNFVSDEKQRKSCDKISVDNSADEKNNILKKIAHSSIKTIETVIEWMQEDLKKYHDNEKDEYSKIVDEVKSIFYKINIQEITIPLHPSQIPSSLS
jgi:hypothetical protein